MADSHAPSLQTLVPTILLVDDDPLILSSMKRILRVLGVEVHTESSGPDALRWIARGGNPEVVISDNSMPGMMGLEFLEQVERRLPNVFRILHTGDASVAVELPAGTMITIVAKPAEPEPLRRLIWAALRTNAERQVNVAQ